MKRPVYNLGIDVQTKSKTALISRLRALKTTLWCVDGGVYFYGEVQPYSQVHLDTYMTESQLDNWLYGTKGVEYVGTFVRKTDEERALEFERLRAPMPA